MIKGQFTDDALILLFLFFSLALAIIIKSLQKACKFLPFTPTLFVVSILMGMFSQSLGIIGDSIQKTSSIDPRGILLIFLPPLIFQSSFNSDWYVFRKQASQIFILAFPSVFISALIIMISIKLIIGYDQSYYNYTQAFMFGAVLSCTDTVAVLALLKQSGAPKKFNSLIEGQSLLNDGTCMILFTISLELCRGGSMSIFDILILFVELTGGAIVLGVLFGVIATEIIKLFKNDPILCYNITLVGCYLLYFTAEYVHLGIHISGIMALVAMGLYMAAFGQTKFSPLSRERVHHIWKVYVFIAETVIFILGGVIVGQKSLNNPELTDLIGMRQMLMLLALYLCMMMARFLSISVFMPQLKKLGYGLRWIEIGALTYGGLRGAVGIAFTLILASNTFLPQKFRSISIFNMAGCAFLTLMINAPTCSKFIIWLGLCHKSQTKVKLFNKFMRICKKQLQIMIEQSKSDKYLSNSNWEKVLQMSGIDQLKNKIDKQKEKEKDNVKQTPLKSLSQSLLYQQEYEGDINTLIQIRNRFGIALKGIFWQKFQNNQCSAQTIKKLTQCVDLDLDTAEQPMNSWDYLISQQQSSFFLPIILWLRQFPLINRYAFSFLYQRVNSLYDLVSIYLEGIQECYQQSKRFPFDQKTKLLIQQEALNNKKLAQAYLQTEIKHSFPQIMKKIQTNKISISLLNYMLKLLQQNHKQGRVDGIFYFQMRINIQNSINKIQNDSDIFQQIPPVEILKKHYLFKNIEEGDLNMLFEQKIEKLIQKNEPISRSYQKMRYIYFIVKGEAFEQWKFPNSIYHKRNLKVKQFVGLSQLYIAHKNEVEYSATATSMVCLYGFPIQRIKQLMLKNEDFFKQVYIQMLPLIAQLTKQIEIQYINYDLWTRLRDKIQFQSVKSDQIHTISSNYVILIEGKIEIDDQMYGVGFYNLKHNFNVKVKGAAKYYKSQQSFITEQFRQNSKLVGQLIINKNSRIIEGQSEFQKALFQEESLFSQK